MAEATEPGSASTTIDLNDPSDSSGAFSDNVETPGLGPVFYTGMTVSSHWQAVCSQK